MKKTTVMDCILMDLPCSPDEAISTVSADNKVLPFKVKRIFYIYGIDSEKKRGAHAHIECHQFLVSLCGDMSITVDDGKNRKELRMSSSSTGLYIPPGIWSEQQGISKGVVCLVLASHAYDEKDYIRIYNDFITYKK